MPSPSDLPAACLSAPHMCMWKPCVTVHVPGARSVSPTQPPCVSLPPCCCCGLNVASSSVDRAAACVQGLGGPATLLPKAVSLAGLRMGASHPRPHLAPRTEEESHLSSE